MLHRYGMKSFRQYLYQRMSPSQLLGEHSDLLPAQEMNRLVAGMALDLLPTIMDQAIKEDVARFSRMNFTGYIDRSLRRAGIPEADRDHLVSDIVVRLVVSPGKLFLKWDRMSPITARFKTAVKNAVITAGKKHALGRRRSQELPVDIQGKKPLSDDLVREFRDFLEVRYGQAAVRVFDVRLMGDQDSKALVGSPGIPTAYALKRIVQQIKTASVMWSQADPAFHQMVLRLVGQEKETFARRFRRRPAPTGAALEGDA